MELDTVKEKLVANRFGGINFLNILKNILHHYNKEDLIELRKFLESKYKRLGEGSSRIAYALSDTLVIKIPHNHYQDYTWAEVSASLFEVLIWRRCKHKKLFTPTRLYFYKSIPVVITERVTLYGFRQEELDAIPKERGDLHDGFHQIGKGPKGIRCFDFGLEDDFFKKHHKGEPDFTLEEIEKILSSRKREISPLLMAA